MIPRPLVALLSGAAVLLVAGRPSEPLVGSLRMGAAGWEVVRPGLELGTLRVSAPGEGRWTKTLLLRIDPERAHLRLDIRLNAELTAGAWTVDSAPLDAVAAFNAGQFNSIAPWGWTVMEGLELRPPGIGPLSLAVVADTAGVVRFVPPDSMEIVRRAGGIQTALQSYPALLTGEGSIPRQLTEPGMGVGIQHRDARLALCQLTDRRLLVLLTRFDGLGDAGGGIPFGLTLRETAELLRSQGCVRAVALDGGISSQLVVRDDTGGTRAWRGWRKVPMGVMVLPK
jgi:hypothetical protein